MKTLFWVMLLGLVLMDEAIKVGNVIGSSVAKAVKKLNKKIVKKTVTKKTITKVTKLITKKIIKYTKVKKVAKKQYKKLATALAKAKGKSERRSIVVELDRLTNKIKNASSKIAGYKVLVKDIKKKSVSVDIAGWGKMTYDPTSKKMQKKCMSKTVIRNIQKLVKKKQKKRLCAFLQEITVPENCDLLESSMEKKFQKVIDETKDIEEAINSAVKKFSSIKKYTSVVKVHLTKAIKYLRRVKGKGYEYCKKIKEYIRSIIYTMKKNVISATSKYYSVEKSVLKSLRKEVKELTEITKVAESFYKDFVKAHPPPKRKFKVITKYDETYQDFAKNTEILEDIFKKEGKILKHITKVYVDGKNNPSALKKRVPEIKKLIKSYTKLEKKAKKIVKKIKKVTKKVKKVTKSVKKIKVIKKKVTKVKVKITKAVKIQKKILKIYSKIKKVVKT